MNNHTLFPEGPKNKTVIIVFLLTLVSIVSFRIGKYSARIYWLTASTSFHVGAYQGSLERIRNGETDKAIDFLEMQLDYEVANLDNQRNEPVLFTRLFVPSHFHSQSDRAILSFSQYRRNVATNYAGLAITTDPFNATEESRYYIERANRNRIKLNKQIQKIIMEN